MSISIPYITENEIKLSFDELAKMSTIDLCVATRFADTSSSGKSMMMYNMLKNRSRRDSKLKQILLEIGVES